MQFSGKPPKDSAREHFINESISNMISSLAFIDSRYMQVKVLCLVDDIKKLKKEMRGEIKHGES